MRTISFANRETRYRRGPIKCRAIAYRALNDVINTVDISRAITFAINRRTKLFIHIPGRYIDRLIDDINRFFLPDNLSTSPRELAPASFFSLYIYTHHRLSIFVHLSLPSAIIELRNSRSLRLYDVEAKRTVGEKRSIALKRKSGTLTLNNPSTSFRSTIFQILLLFCNL